MTDTPTTFLSYDDAVDLVNRAADGIVTQEAKDRLVNAVLSHNDGRVRRFLSLSVAARTTAYDLSATDDEREGRMNGWSRNLHRALDEAWPVDHPAYRRHDVRW